MPVYDQEKTDDLNALTGISKAEEKAIDARANDSPDSLRPDQLATAERSADNPGASPTSQAELQTFGSAGGGGNFGESKENDKESLSDSVANKVSEGFTYKNSEGKRRFRLSRAQGGGVVTGLLAAGTLGVMGILSGPLQLIHISQLLTSFHFSPMENFTDDRNSRLGRYIRHFSQGNPQNVRMGVLGNNIADRIESRMNKSGLQSAYQSGFGYQEGFRLIPSEIADGSELKSLEGADENTTKRQLADRYGIDPSKISFDPDNPGVIRIGSADNPLSTRELRATQRTVLREAGYTKIGAALRSRIMFRRGGVSLHPLKRLDRKIYATIEGRIAKFKEDRKDRIKRGVDPPDANTQGRDRQTDQEGRETQEDTRSEADQGRQNIEPEGDNPDARKSSIKSKIGVGAGAIVALVGTVCAIQSIAEQVDQVRFENVSLPMIRMGGEAIAIGNQIMTGQDVDYEQLNVLLGQLYDSESNQSWASAASIQAELGQAVTGPDVPDEVSFRAGENPVTQFVNMIPKIDSICEVATSGPVTVISTVAGFAFAAVSTAVGEAFSRLVAGPLLDSLVNTLAGEEINVEVAGANYGNYINYGSRLAAADNGVSAGALPLTQPEVTELEEENERIKQEDTQYASVYDRYFNVYKHDSAVSSFLMSPQIMYGNGLVRMAQNPFSSFAGFGSLFSSLFTPASAQSGNDYDYGFDEYGFSLAEQEDPAVSNPFQNAEDVDELIRNSSRLDAINERTSECFGITLTADGDYNSADEPVNIHAIEQDCFDPPSDLNQTQWLKVRMYIHDIQTLTAMSCYESIDENDCIKIGLDTSSQTNLANQGEVANLTDLGQPSDSIACATGTNDVGVHDGYFQGNIVRIKLCAIPNFPSTSSESTPGSSFYVEGAEGNVLVNSRISTQVLAMFNAANSENISFRATSSFRTMAHQQNLCNNDDKCPGGVYTDVARPGTSNHQLGVAIDFNLGHGFSNSVNFYSPEGGGTPGPDNPRITPARNSDVWTWLNENASTYGMEPYWNEPWHWSPFGG